MRRTERLRENIHLERSVELQRTWVELSADGPALSVEVSQPVEPTQRPPVLLVHGLAQNRFTWRISQRSLVGALVEAGYPVLNLELRGHGLSRSYGSGNAERFHDYVDDVVRVVRACEVAPFAMGHSLGGGVLVGASAEVRFAGIVHLAGVYHFARHNRVLRGIARLSLELEQVLTVGGIRVSTGWAGDVLGRLYALTDVAGYGLPLAGWVPGSLERPLLEERLSLGFDWTSLEVWMEMSRWARGAPFPYAEGWRTTDVPLLVMAGDLDPLVPPSDAVVCFDESGSSDKAWQPFDLWEHDVHFGHIDLLLGHQAPDIVWPAITSWLDARG